MGTLCWSLVEPLMLLNCLCCAGGFAFVYLCEDADTGELLVLKRMQVPVEHEDNLVVAR